MQQLDAQVLFLMPTSEADFYDYCEKHNWSWDDYEVLDVAFVENISEFILSAQRANKNLIVLNMPMGDKEIRTSINAKLRYRGYQTHYHFQEVSFDQFSDSRKFLKGMHIQDWSISIGYDNYLRFIQSFKDFKRTEKGKKVRVTFFST